MAELLKAYNRDGSVLKVGERKALLAEMRSVSEKTGDAPFSVDVVHVLLKDKVGNLLIVQRAQKPENPNMFDKTAGGHVAYPESHDESFLRELGEELSVGATISRTLEAYRRDLTETDLTKKAVVRKVAESFWHRSDRVLSEKEGGGTWLKRDNPHLYVGRYDGGVRFKDCEAKDIIRPSVDGLTRLMAEKPAEYTYDLKELVRTRLREIMEA